MKRILGTVQAGGVPEVQRAQLGKPLKVQWLGIHTLGEDEKAVEIQFRQIFQHFERLIPIMREWVIMHKVMTQSWSQESKYLAQSSHSEAPHGAAPRARQVGLEDEGPQRRSERRIRSDRIDETDRGEVIRRPAKILKKKVRGNPCETLKVLIVQV